MYQDEEGTLNNTISYEAAAKLIGAAPETVDSPPTDAEDDADVSDGHEGERSDADEDNQTGQCGRNANQMPYYIAV